MGCDGDGIGRAQGPPLRSTPTHTPTYVGEGLAPSRSATEKARRRRFHVAIVGSGFAGSILARLLAHAGRSVLLVERGRHPRFALGESSTPLAAIALERLAARLGDDGDDLRALAAAGRWHRRLDGLGRGLKRGFTFYRHRPGEPYAAGPDSRLLVAASPDDEIADNHWLRADVDHHLVRRAEAAGATLVEGCELTAVEERDDGISLTGRHDDGTPFAAEADFLVDASGPGGFLARCLPIPGVAPETPETSLIHGHFRGASRFAAVLRETGEALPEGPYPDDRAAVHHLLDEGWAYALRFDPEDADGGALTSFGVVLRRKAAERLFADHPEPTDALAALLARYPALAATLRDAEPVRPVARVGEVAHRLARATGWRWLLLPHAYAFFDPLFSTGIAWSLVGVERVAELLAEGVPGEEDLAAYERLLSQEADHASRLIAGAWASMDDFRAFVAHTMLYFAAASWCEARQRLLDGDHVWSGFLGAADELLSAAVEQAVGRLVGGEGGEAYERWVRETIAPRNLAGLADPARENLYPVDLEALVAAAGLLGMSEDEMREALPRLRGSS